MKKIIVLTFLIAVFVSASSNPIYSLGRIVGGGILCLGGYELLKESEKQFNIAYHWNNETEKARQTLIDIKDRLCLKERSPYSLLVAYNQAQAFHCCAGAVTALVGIACIQKGANCITG